MIEQDQIEKIKEEAKEFFEKMTIAVSDIEISMSSEKKESSGSQNSSEEIRDVINLDVQIDEPQILIGQQGQTLFEIQHILRTILNKKLSKSSAQKSFFLNLDINGYKRKKIEYLKYLAKDSADQVVASKEEKVLLPMSSYERRVIHSELAQRTDVITESQGEDSERHIVIKPR